MYSSYLAILPSEEEMITWAAKIWLKEAHMAHRAPALSKKHPTMVNHTRTTTNTITIKRQTRLIRESTPEINNKMEPTATAQEWVTEIPLQKRLTVNNFLFLDNYQNALNKLETDQLYNNKGAYNDSYRDSSVNRGSNKDVYNNNGNYPAKSTVNRDSTKGSYRNYQE